MNSGSSAGDSAKAARWVVATLGRALDRACYVQSVAAVRIQTVLSAATLELPELAPLVGHRVELTVRDIPERTWPEGWFEAIEGAIDDPTFERAPQPELESRSLPES